MRIKKFGGKIKIGGGGVKVGNGSSVTILGERPRNCWSEKMIITASFLIVSHYLCGFRNNHTVYALIMLGRSLIAAVKNAGAF